MALSFIATGIVWRWLLDNGDGAQTAGLNRLFTDVGLGFLRSDWHRSDSAWAIAAVALPAGWALSGYVMALFLAGMRTIPEDLREAARIDGASERRSSGTSTAAAAAPRPAQRHRHPGAHLAEELRPAVRASTSAT